ncbi:MAG: bifunctional 4-hydroxy-2-oxoglutarate aldolase/2-dehydro-3-deoxy-phosphogluconate aldolase [Solobacterium sp.]|jgi:2-dehydro-3-deoxyphosphogluconate aldolase/(4S)-4-hydroxy-2-oxoglutarate aldolase|nr:bifunctional 4-hydroxy-2-oxoglutarate aldolase/2-dehydro-3-deoxy-phosphogluconate aldolase [Solobacterium sp.]MCH4204802.1 bifunctional 4-hydroxy-2-oxoglutarate aldolase/2-dehydro-3-deoxy-phosphogluconate aldolase [Solobacterium sp.]MCH4226426.1 bifunctional 4-hydroxy-2-oxoglutarate aldolase/2-dehydro-3-deoxy-phosphogluconate aldolase [Solobacterium sp.]MCH4282416.1 bifunctional 4-hydroxy-2-oxoglutarate aldolase/2-dehydro-3-deoxy-phosphogluconate aldolase [Solobacterium sp.]
MSDSKDVMKRLHGIGIIPAIVLDRVEDAAPLADALCKGGLPAAEVTFRTPAAHDAMIAMKKQRPELIVGAGTVLTKEQVDSALDAGAEFIVAPGLNPEVVKYCQEKGVAVCPGISSASELEQALALGLHTVKFFPAEAMGGIKTIKALCGPYKTMTFLPTGGVNTNNMLDYLSFNKIFAVGGTWMVKGDLIKNGRFDEVERISREAVLKMLGMHIKHIGINCTEADGRKTADTFANLLQGTVRETSKGYFGSEMIEVMVKEHFGTKGHIAIGVNNVERALAYYRALGFAFDEDSITYDEAGDAKFAYFKDEIGGFRVHFVNN